MTLTHPSPLDTHPASNPRIHHSPEREGLVLFATGIPLVAEALDAHDAAVEALHDAETARLDAFETYRSAPAQHDAAVRRAATDGKPLPKAPDLAALDAAAVAAAQRSDVARNATKRTANAVDKAIDACAAEIAAAVGEVLPGLLDEWREAAERFVRCRNAFREASNVFVGAEHRVATLLLDSLDVPSWQKHGLASNLGADLANARPRRTVFGFDDTTARKAVDEARDASVPSSALPAVRARFGIKG